MSNHKLSRAEIQEHLEKLFWDYDIDKSKLFALLYGEIDRINFIDRNKLYERILKYFDWYLILKIVPRSQLKNMLSSKNIKSLFPKSLQEQYLYVQKIISSAR